MLLGDGGVSDPSRVMTIFAVYPELSEGMQQQPIHPRQVASIEEAPAAEAVAGFKAGYFNLTGQGSPRRLDGMLTTPGLFRVGGRPPPAGAGLRRRAHRRRARGRAVLAPLAGARGATPPSSDRRCSSTRSRTRWSGVMPDGFAFPRREDVPSTFRFPHHPDVWVPYALPQRGPSDLGVVARLRPGASLAELQGRP